MEITDNKDNKKKLNYKVTLCQSGVYVTFRLNSKEYNALKLCRNRYGRCYNFAIFALADNDISRAKCGRFHKFFNYHKGDFDFYEE